MPVVFIWSLFLLIALCSPGVAEDAENRPNIVLFLADDMGMGDTSAYRDWTGNSEADQLHTPNMERLARRGVRFTDAHSPSSRCSPTRYALLTGRYCWRTRLKQWVLFGVHCPPLINRDRLTLPEFLQDAGYRTGMVGKWHLGLTYRRADGQVAEGWDDADLTRNLIDGPLDHGFDYFFGISRSHPTSGPDDSVKKRNGLKQKVGPGWIEGRCVIGATGRGKSLDGSYRLREIGPRLHEKSLQFLKTNAEKPFFLYFAAAANHGPYTPCEKIANRPVTGASRFVDGRSTGSERLDFVYENDVQIGLLLDHLATTKDPRRPGHRLIENTVFVFASDNGAEVVKKTATGPLRSHKGSVYEGGHRIPFIVSWPVGGIGDGNENTPGATRSRLLGLNDIYATVGAILKKPLPKPAIGAGDSFSQLAAMRGESTKPRPPLFPNDHQEGRTDKARPEQRAWVAVRSNGAPVPGQWKLFLDEHFALKGEIRPRELYNLESDPMEKTNLLGRPETEAVVRFLSREAELAKRGTTR